MAWGQPLEYVESLPMETISEFKALNVISPFTPEAQAYRQAFTATILYNQGTTKKSKLKSVSDLFPYLGGNIPDELEHPTIKHARDLFKAVALQRGAPKVYESSMATLIEKVNEEIEIEQAKNDPDLYVIRTLQSMITKGG